MDQQILHNMLYFTAAQTTRPSCALERLVLRFFHILRLDELSDAEASLLLRKAFKGLPRDGHEAANPIASTHRGFSRIRGKGKGGKKAAGNGIFSTQPCFNIFFFF